MTRTEAAIALAEACCNYFDTNDEDPAAHEAWVAAGLAYHRVRHQPTDIDDITKALGTDLRDDETRADCIERLLVVVNASRAMRSAQLAKSAVWSVTYDEAIVALGLPADTTAEAFNRALRQVLIAADETVTAFNAAVDALSGK